MILTPLAKFVEDHQPEEWVKDEEYIVYHGEGSRFRIIVEHGRFGELSSYFAGLWRTEELAEQGISAGCADAIEFGERLVETMFYHLSPHQMQHVVNALNRDLTKWEAERDAEYAKRPEVYGTVLPSALSERCKD